MDRQNSVRPDFLVLVGPTDAAWRRALTEISVRCPGFELVTYKGDDPSKGMKAKDWAAHAKFVSQCGSARGRVVAVVDRPLPSLTAVVPDLVVLETPSSLSETDRKRHNTWLDLQGRVTWIAHAGDYITFRREVNDGGADPGSGG